jgi:hypothetical protein
VKTCQGAATERICRQCEKEGADQEQTGRPINAVRRNAENHDEKIFEGSPAQRRPPAQNNVVLCPGMIGAVVVPSSTIAFSELMMRIF